MNRDSAVNLQAEVLSNIFGYTELAGAQSLSVPEAPVFMPSSQIPLASSIGSEKEYGDFDKMMSDPAVNEMDESLRIGVGIRPSTDGINGNDYAVVLLCQNEADLNGNLVSRAKATAGDDIVARFTGPLIVNPYSVSGGVPAVNTLKIGASCAHINVSAGTVGGFVNIGNQGPYILSNNHVLANVNQGVAGDDVLYPSDFDGGSSPQNKVAELDTYIPLGLGNNTPNDVDAALAIIEDAINVDRHNLDGSPTGPTPSQFAGVMNAILSLEHVWKIGRTTNWTDGTVLSINQSTTTTYIVNGVRQIAHFTGQISIEGTNGHFSRPGDSGSMILNDNNEAVGLLFAGTNTGGSNGGGITFANPMIQVMQSLGATF